MNTSWTRQALVGIDTQPSLPADGEIGALLTKLAAGIDDPARAFACAAGAISACRLAAVTIEAVDEPLPEPAPADARALTPSHPWAATLASVFADGPPRLQFEACLRLAAIRATLPLQLLPTALEAGRRNQALRAPLVATIGHRGHWLAQFNADWRYAAAGVAPDTAAHDAKSWDEGSLAQRLGYLRAKRAADPAAARELLCAQWGELPAKERVELLGVLETGLGSDDEGFLDPLLKDRSREVRSAAAGMLARVPQSSHARRLAGWLEPLLKHERHFLRRSWRIEAPQQADPAWSSAAIEATRPQHESLGERAWWLYQLVRQLSLTWWPTHTGMQAAELLAWADASDWKEALHRGWRERVGADDRAWIEAMLGSSAKEYRNDAARLLALLPVGEREKHWPRTLDELLQQGLLGTVVASCAHGESLSADYSRAVLAGLHEAFASDRMRSDYYLRGVMLELAAIVHPHSLANLAPIPRRDDETPALGECMLEFERILAIRRILNS